MNSKKVQSFTPNKSAMGCMIIGLGSLAVGLQTGVIMAGRADNRGTTRLNGLHLIGTGVWGGFVSIIAGILGMMSDKRTKMPFAVPKYYQPFFCVLAGFNFLGFMISIVSLGVNGAIIGDVAEYCSTSVEENGLWMYVDLFCYGIVAAVILIPVTITLLILHGIFSFLCILTMRHTFFSTPYEGRSRLRTRSSNPSTGSIVEGAVVRFDESNRNAPPRFEGCDNAAMDFDASASWESQKSIEESDEQKPSSSRA